MVRNTSLPNGTLRSTSSSLLLRLRQRFRKKLKFISKLLLAPQSNHHQVVLLLLAAVLIFFSIKFVISFSSNDRSFDDVADMRLLAEQEAEYVRQKQNESTDLGDPLRLLNASDIYLTRRSFDYFYGEIVRKPVQPVFTKYKSRLFRDLFRRTHYIMMNKLAPTIDVSCNYLNDVNDEGSLFAFKCSETSHRCPDGQFELRPAFAPAEGSSVTWNDVVIVLVVSAGREPYLQAAADTWISRLNPEATLYFGVDQDGPSLPQSILDRPNTYVHECVSFPGVVNLDFKVLEVWDKVYQRFGVSGKKFFLKIDDDSFLLGHNLIRFLNKVEHWFSGREDALYFGHPFCGHGDLAAMGYEKWCYAGGGAYGLSIEALQIMLTQIKGGCVYFYDYVMNAENMRPVDDRYGGRYEDVMIGRCLRQARRRSQLRGTSLLACGSFFPYAPLHYYEKFGRTKEAMCNKFDGEPITIHNLEPSAIRYLDHIVFEYPLGGDISLFSPENERMDELIRVCELNGKKMSCDLSLVPSF